MRQQKEARLEKQRLAREIKNTRRKRARLVKRARLLSTEELLQVVCMRERVGVTPNADADTPEDEAEQSEHSADEERGRDEGRQQSPEIEDEPTR